MYVFTQGVNQPCSKSACVFFFSRKRKTTTVAIVGVAFRPGFADLEGGESEGAAVAAAGGGASGVAGKKEGAPAWVDEDDAGLKVFCPARELFVSSYGGVS